MKRRLLKTIMFGSIILLSFTVNAQGPPNPPEDPSLDGGPVGGSAPLDDGAILLIFTALVWGGYKSHLAYKKQEATTVI